LREGRLVEREPGWWWLEKRGGEGERVEVGVVGGVEEDVEEKEDDAVAEVDIANGDAGGKIGIGNVLADDAGDTVAACGADMLTRIAVEEDVDAAERDESVRDMMSERKLV